VCVCLYCNYVKTEKGGKILRFLLIAQCQTVNMPICDKVCLFSSLDCGCIAILGLQFTRGWSDDINASL